MANSIITHLKQNISLTQHKVLIKFAKPNLSLKYILLYLYIPMQSVPLSLRAEANKSENLAPKEAYLEKYKNIYLPFSQKRKGKGNSKTCFHILR